MRISPTAPALVLFETLANVISVSSDCKLASGLLWTSRAPALARSFDVPLCRAVCNHFASDGFSKRNKFDLPFHFQTKSLITYFCLTMKVQLRSNFATSWPAH